jgi:hypothetical protein
MHSNPIGRLADELREMRWAHVVVELVLLVLGILIALAVNDWMQDRRDAQTERQYLELLARDLDQDLEVLKEFAAYEERQTADGVMAYRALRDPAEVADKEAIAEALSRLMSRRTLRLVRATYTDLLSTGNIRLIRNTGLRDRIVKLYEANERVSTIIDRNNQAFVDQMYMGFMMSTGLIAPRSGSNLRIIDAELNEFTARIGLPVNASADRLWGLPADAPERKLLNNHVWQRAEVSFQAIARARSLIADIRGVREAIGHEVASRSPQ